ncbi:MAG: TlpA disulfide reductase family protein [Phycisphaerae bacterium]|mgnify:CR=1 FL=1|nr:TlpA disulfide reductase family protein [Phycisphaerae bacterium]
MRSTVFVVTTVMFISARAAAQSAILEPAAPRAGEALTVRYRPSDANAKLPSSARCYTALKVRTLAGDTTVWGAMAPMGDSTDIGLSFNLPSDASAGFVYLFTLDPLAAHDSVLESGFTIERATGSGIASALSAPDAVDRFRRWRTDHPTDSNAVLDAWDALARFGDATGEIEALLPDLDVGSAASDAGASALRLIGRARVRKFDECAAIAKELVERFPSDPWTDGAIGEFVERSGAASDAARADELRPTLVRLAEGFPAANTFRRGGLAIIASDSGTPLELVDRCADAWAASREGDASPFFLQASARIARSTELDRAESLLSRGIDALLRPADSAFSDPHRERFDARLREALLLRSTLAAKRNDGPAALLFAMAARGVSEQVDSAASPSIREAIAAGWQMTNGPKLSASTTPIGATVVGSASSGGDDATPDFALKDTSGNDVMLSGLRGKVVVLNFWFVGCAPCRHEMPLLNDLMQKYVGKNVEFLAPCLDSASRCSEFLANNEFRYRSLVDASPAVSAFHVKVFPTHVVIDQNGRVTLLRTGGGALAVRDVATAIEAALSSP